ncbi:MAG: 5-(carboxyamino)imidazole ribonucleotide mutase [Chloroflexota bacterium]|nr:MAG: 5-(carboxyamino)imidazole ribonucleotide mutase [Chloroflexota bacterium]
MQATADILTEMGIAHEVVICSAHRQPEKARQYALTAGDRGLKVLIAGAGAAAHLPGVLASWCTLPVIGVPLPGSDLKGLDSLMSIVQMPSGVPVATMAIGLAGARNAAYFAAQIVGLWDATVAMRYEHHRHKLAEG